MAHIATNRSLRNRSFTRRVPVKPPDARIGTEGLEGTSALRDQLKELAVLEEAVELGGSDAADAAFVRFAGALGESEAKRSRLAVLHLREHGHEGSAALVEALHIARWHGDYDTAELLILPYRDRTWAKTARLHLAIGRGRWELIEMTMAELMEAGPGQLLRLLLLPARDPTAPSPERLKAYRSLLRVLDGRLVDPKFAQALHFAWIKLSTPR